MHIETANIHINLGGGPLAAAVLAGLIAGKEADHEAAAKTPSALPKIGEAWPGIGGVYAGLSRGENGEADAHLVLLNPKPDGLLEWAAAVKWAEGLGEGARLPTRFESALLYANLQDQLDTDRWHWTGTQYCSGDAWGQHFGFGTGGQNGLGHSNECRARAVRRLIL